MTKWAWKGAIALVFMVGLHAMASSYNLEVHMTPPTERVDGSPITPEEIAGYELCVVPEGGDACVHTYNSAVTHFTMPLPELVGTYNIQARVQDKNGVFSDWSVPVTKTFDPTQSGPKPPISIEIRIIIVTAGGV